MVVGINFDEEQITQADALAVLLTRRYGVKVSRSHVVRQALTAFLAEHRSLERPEPIEETEPTAKQ